MYQNESFYIAQYNNSKIFCPEVASVFKILADNEYFHCCDDEEKANYPQNTIAFIRCIQGQGAILLNSKKVILKENECAFFSFYDIKEYKTVSNIWGYRWVNFFSGESTKEFELNKIYSIPQSENEDIAFNKLLRYGQTLKKNSGYISALFLNYFYSVMLENTFDEKEVMASEYIRLIDEICSYIHQMLYSKVSIDEIAGFFKITPRRLHQIFTKEMNISPKQYILKKKMEEGYRLIVQTSVPINKIAYMLCFSSPYHFSNEFKKTFSQSPSEVRKIEQTYDK
ncbi:MAG: helix-turn-helix domain-containing protein [Eubacterium sp.]